MFEFIKEIIKTAGFTQNILLTIIFASKNTSQTNIKMFFETQNRLNFMFQTTMTSQTSKYDDYGTNSSNKNCWITTLYTKMFLAFLEHEYTDIYFLTYYDINMHYSNNYLQDRVWTFFNKKLHRMRAKDAPINVFTYL